MARRPERNTPRHVLCDVDLLHQPRPSGRSNNQLSRVISRGQPRGLLAHGIVPMRVSADLRRSIRNGSMAVSGSFDNCNSGNRETPSAAFHACIPVAVAALEADQPRSYVAAPTNDPQVHDGLRQMSQQTACRMPPAQNEHGDDTAPDGTAYWPPAGHMPPVRAKISTSCLSTWRAQQGLDRISGRPRSSGRSLVKASQ